MLNLTDEQKRIVEAVENRPGIVVVEAFAGSGKTYTTIALMERLKNERVAYFVFNSFMKKAIEWRAKLHGIENASFFTYHSFMLHQALKNDKLKSFFVDEEGNYNIDFAKSGYDIEDIASAFGKIGVGKRTFALRVVYLLAKEWLNSEKSTNDFVKEYSAKLFEGEMLEIEEYINKEVLAQELRSETENIVRGVKALENVAPSSLEPKHLLSVLLKRTFVELYKSFKLTHEGYYKRVYEIALKHKINLFEGFDTVIVDEAQDIDPIFKELLLFSGKKIILLGDEHQSIYSFRKAVNMISLLKGRADKVLPLTRSFRFTDDVAEYCNALFSLKSLPPSEKIVGNFTPEIVAISGGSVDEKGFSALAVRFLEENTAGLDIKKMKKKELQKEATKKKIAFIARKNRTLVKVVYETLKSLRSREDLKDMAFYSLTEAVSEEFYKIGKLEFDGYVRKLVEGAEGTAYKKAVKGLDLRQFTERYASILKKSDKYSFLLEEGALEEFSEILESLKSRKKDSLKKDDKNANIVFTTAHGSKGKEYDTVVVADDFSLEKGDEEINMAYVAVSRVRSRLFFYGEGNPLLRLFEERRKEIEQSLLSKSDGEVVEKIELYKNAFDVRTEFDERFGMFRHDFLIEEKPRMRIFLPEKAKKIELVWDKSLKAPVVEMEWFDGERLRKEAYEIDGALFKETRHFPSSKIPLKKLSDFRI